MTKQRLAWITMIGLIAFLTIWGRLFYLQVVQHAFFETKSKHQLTRLIKLFPYRGNIYDRHQRPLALTAPSMSVYAIPPKIDDITEFVDKISPILDLDKDALAHQLATTQSPFIWLKRQCDPSLKPALAQFDHTQVGTIKTQRRVYPNQGLASHITGFVGVDNQGLGGLEYTYDEQLKGSEGQIILEGDPRGRQLLSGQRSTIPNKDGSHIVTTIDERIQFSAETHLEHGVNKAEAVQGHVVVLDPQSGDILAMANYPSFDANHWSDASAQTRKNRSVLDVYEPGSIFKVITLAGVLEEDLVRPNTMIDVPETLTLYGHEISEAHDRDPEDPDEYSVTDILGKSLNVGTSLLANKLGKERFYKYMVQFGFGKPTDIQLSGESKGLLRAPKQWSGVDLAMMSFGQGVAVTPIQMAAAIGAIANDGEYMKPRIVQYVTDANFERLKAEPMTSTHRIISKTTATEIQDMMVNVVEQGTGQIVKIPGYSIAGKTGTAQKAKKNGRGYAPGEYLASFVGFFPAEDPKALILVMIDTPKTAIWGSAIAGPIFKSIAQDIIHHYHIEPSDQPLEHNSVSLSTISSQ